MVTIVSDRAQAAAAWNAGEAYVQELGPGLYGYLQPPGTWRVSNMGFLVGRNQTIAVDTSTSEARTRAYIQAMEQVGGQPIRTLVNTHHHSDHTYGNCLLPEAVVIGHRLCREKVIELGLHLTNPIFQEADLGALTLRPPTVTFEDSMELWLDERRIELRFIGNVAHSPCDCYLWVEDCGVLFAGDLVVSGSTPFFATGSLQGTLAAIAKLRLLGARTILPGHGPVCGPEAYDEIEAYALYVRDLAENGLVAGKSPMETAREADLSSFGHLRGPERLIANLHRAYAELQRMDVDLSAGFLMQEMRKFAFEGRPIPTVL